MARVTVEDCIAVVPNRYELVLLSAQRARDISAGALPTVDRDNDKNTVIALREIADQTINLDDLRRHIARGVNRQAEMSAEDDALLALSGAGFGAAAAEAALAAGDMGFEEIEFEETEEVVTVETEENSEEETTTEGEAKAMTEEDVSDEDVAAAMEALMQDMPDVEEDEAVVNS